MSKNETTAMATLETSALAKNETATAAQAAQAQAMILAQFQVALARPRNMGDVRQALLLECERPRFAESARYMIPFKGGKPARGYTIRFAEAAGRIMGNLSISTPTVYEDEDKRIVKATVVDLESNIVYDKDVVIEKVVERKPDRLGGRQPIGMRKNAYNDDVCLVRATDQELRAKVGSEISKAIRDNILRILPADIKEECENKIARVLADDDAQNPGEATRRISDGFLRLGVRVSDLEKLLGHKLEQTIPAELAMLRWYYTALRDAEITWPELVDAHKRGPTSDDDEEPNPYGDLIAQAQEALHQTKTKAKQRKRSKKKQASGKAKSSTDGSPPPPESDTAPSSAESSDSKSSSDPSEDGDASDPRTDEQIAQGYELDPNTNEVIPPPGAEG